MIDQKVALVTGGNRGIGFEVCRQLSAKGFRVYLGARRREEGIRACAALADTGAAVQFLDLDMANADSIRAAANRIRALTDRLHVLVNNAGICEDQELSVLEVDARVIGRTLEINTIGPVLLTQALWPLLVTSQAGRVINVSSGLGALNSMSSGYPAYRMSKAALNAFTRIAAAELATRKVAVNSVSPGWVRTDMGGPDATSSVEQGADTIVWLATEAPQSLTGQFLADRQSIPW